MMELKHLDFTEQDFQLLVDGLDSLPNKDVAGEMMHDLLLGMIDKGDSPAVEKAKAERELKRKQAEQKKRQQIEDIRILQGKLLMLKRWMATQGALKAVDDIINPVK